MIAVSPHSLLVIKNLSIRNFKSVRELDLSCRRVNVFIGEPNAGKTNVLEALGLHCSGVWGYFRKILRAESLRDVFSQQDSSNPMTIEVDDVGLSVAPANGGIRLLFSEHGGSPDMPSCSVTIDDERDEVREFEALPEDHWQFPVQYYLFNSDASQDDVWDSELSAPFGENLANLLANNKGARQTAATFFVNQRYKLTIDRGRHAVVIAHEEDGALVSLPYNAASETLRRMVFFHLAIDSNTDHTLVFDEPEAHAYPPYTKILAEKIALDNRGNQFFLTTHSPYMLDSLISKTPADDLNIILCRMENFETKAYVMSDEQKVQIMEWSMDAFFNFDRLLPEIA